MTDPKPLIRARIDIVAEGHGTVELTGGTLDRPRSARIVRLGVQDYRVDDDQGHEVGHVQVYRTAARMLARHYGLLPQNTVHVRVNNRIPRYRKRGKSHA